MSLIRRNPKRDANEKGLVAYLRHCGCLVRLLSGEGLPDLLVGISGYWVLAEVKSPGGSLTPSQSELIASAGRLRLPVRVLRTNDDVRNMVEEFAAYRRHTDSALAQKFLNRGKLHADPVGHHRRIGASRRKADA